MVDRQTTSHGKATRDLHARISSQRFFCVDNNPYFREFVRWFLSDVGCEVKGVATAMERLSMIWQEPALSLTSSRSMTTWMLTGAIRRSYMGV
jgi:hypothetical protein